MARGTSLPNIRQKRSVGTWLTLLGLSAIAAALTFRGHDFYIRTLDARFDHPDYRVLGPSGLVGHGYGIVGTVLILTNLLYLARRRLAWLPIGSMARWLDLHVFTGLAGSLLILFHSAFQLRTPIASVTAGSLAVAVVTGIVGRYIYALLPREGRARLPQRLAELEPMVPAFVSSVRKALEATPTTRLPANVHLPRVVLTIPRWVFEARARRRAVRHVAAESPELRDLATTQRRLIRRMVRDLARLAGREVDVSAIEAGLRTWRSIHRYMALLLVLSVTVHIAVAWIYGYRWIFS